MGLIDRLKGKPDKSDGQQDKKKRKVVKAVKKEKHKKGIGSRFGSSSKELHQCELLRKRRNNNKVRRKMVQVGIKKLQIHKRRNKKYQNPKRYV